MWEKVDSKRVKDSDGFYTDYVWYKNGDKHIFMFGDEDFTEPDADYADWEADSEKEAKEWFDNYTGFEDEFDTDFEEDDYTSDDDKIEYDYTIISTDNDIRVASEDFDNEDDARDYFWSMIKQGYKVTLVANSTGASTSAGPFHFANTDENGEIDESCNKTIHGNVDEEVTDDVKDDDGAWDYKTIYKTAEDLTNNFEVGDGVFKTYFESEKEHIKNILSQHDYKVEISDGRTSSNEDMCWVIAYRK